MNGPVELGILHLLSQQKYGADALPDVMCVLPGERAILLALRAMPAERLAHITKLLNEDHESRQEDKP